jgi:protein-S-isoprenylcysteine O-methyltransferase Ste14
MNNEMKIAGVAPLIAIPTFLYLGLTILINYSAGGIFTITEKGYSILLAAGVVMIVTGVLMVASCGRKLLKSFNSGKLMTDGLYKIFRNPMYAAYMLFVVPGICLLFNSWLVLTAVIINSLLFFIFIRKEHRYLQEKFGKEYEEYLQKIIIRFL